MREKFGPDGLAFITVSLDEVTKGIEARAVSVLRGKKVTFATNLLLDEESEFWTKKLHFTTYPCVFVFDRAGKWTMFNSDTKDINYDDVDKLVAELVKPK